MFNVRLAGGHLYGKQLFTWLSLVVSLMASFVLSFFPLDVVDEIWDLIEAVSEGFLTYSFNLHANSRNNIPLKAQEIVPPGIKSDRVLSSLKRRAGYHELKLSSSNWEHAPPIRIGVCMLRFE